MDETASKRGVVDRWAQGSAYESFMGRWSRRLAPKFVSWLKVPDQGHWLDVGCGTGALTEAICRIAHPSSVVGCDPAEPFVAYAGEHFHDQRASFVVAGAGELPPRDDGYDCIASLLVLNFLPNPGEALHEMRELGSRGGTIAACVWDYADGMQFLRYFWDVAVARDPSAEALDEGNRFPISRRKALEDLFDTAGLQNVTCDGLDISMEFRGFEDYWKSFLEGTGPAPSYVASLDEDLRDAIAKDLEQLLPRDPNGSIRLSARAWAARGTNDVLVRS